MSAITNTIHMSVRELSLSQYPVDVCVTIIDDDLTISLSYSAVRKQFVHNETLF